VAVTALANLKSEGWLGRLSMTMATRGSADRFANFRVDRVVEKMR